jgi:hypothetical protein
MADGIQVGHALADYRYRWTAFCWSVAGEPAWGWRYEVKAGDLAGLRAKVRGLFSESGPWWSEMAATEEAK